MARFPKPVVVMNRRACIVTLNINRPLVTIGNVKSFMNRDPRLTWCDKVWMFGTLIWCFFSVQLSSLHAPYLSIRKKYKVLLYAKISNENVRSSIWLFKRGNRPLLPLKSYRLFKTPKLVSEISRFIISHNCSNNDRIRILPLFGTCRCPSGICEGIF